MRPVGLLLCGLLACVTLGCKSRDSNEGKRMPKAPPPPEVDMADVSIAVEIDGAPAAPIDARRLRAAKPDFEDRERRAWRLDLLLGAPAQRPGAQITMMDASGIMVSARRPTRPEDPLPVLMLTRRGEVITALVDARDPFPAYHGRGGRLARPGDPLPRVTHPSLVRVTLGDGDGGR